jgi:hypothetical protein
MIYFLAMPTNFGNGKVIRDTVFKVLSGNPAELLKDVMGLIPAIIQIVVGLFMLVLIKHATAATEFNRDCMDGAGMRNYTVFVFFVFLAVGAYVVLPFLGIPQGVQAALNTNVLIAAAIAFVSFILDCVIKSKPKTESIGASDELDMEAYFQGGTTII